MEHGERIIDKSVRLSSGKDMVTSETKPNRKPDLEIEEDGGRDQVIYKTEYKSCLESFRYFAEETSLHGIRSTCEPSTGKLRRL